ncbi:MAG: response regulator transcription factor [Bacteroidia bacterium]
MPNKKNILLVEDDTNLGYVVQDNLEMNGYNVTLCTNGKDGLEKFKKSSYSLCVLDVMLPQKDGFTLASDIKKINASTPIIFLTAKALAEDKIKGLTIGADDYLTKPFNFDELLLRIEAVLRRTSNYQSSNEEEKFKLGNLSFDSKNYQLLKNGKLHKKLTKKEAEILKILCQKQGETVERGMILNLVWGEDTYFNGRSLDVFITKLRKYTQDETIEITNVHGVGFKLEK